MKQFAFLLVILLSFFSLSCFQAKRASAAEQNGDQVAQIQGSSAATRPSTTELLHSIVTEQSQEIVRLQSQVDALQRQVDQLQHQLVIATLPKSTHETRFQEWMNERAPLKDDNLNLWRCRDIDSKIIDYLATNPQPREIEEGLFGGIPKVGMPEEAMKIAFDCTLTAHNNGRVYWITPPIFCGPKSVLNEWVIGVEGGKITSVSLGPFETHGE